MVYFYPIVGWTLFFIGFIVAIALFANYKKMYIIFYLISTCLYIFTASFMIDVFEFQELGILTTLVVSAIIFMILGWHFSRIYQMNHGK